ncbi:MAG: hypothetical protein BGO01_02585 [Armatimonadetes bacterium 55-13]|mgnify:CR=1 FL=1|nr:NnrS family protein [Armatimonadota bacterium]OJU62141.1 MAG: hypothetical protein BGO01_02585 [Armatimonadetes bacterium 55-13]
MKVELRLLPQMPPTPGPNDRAFVEIYRPFFLAGILSVLTVGCLLGAVALLGIGGSGSYTSASWAPYILAHANSQLYGWVGFFVMGFALQQHAPTMAKRIAFHRLAWASLVLMGIGIALRFVAEPLVRTDRETWLPIGVGSAVLQAVSVALFMFNTSYTRHRSGAGLTWQSLFVFASLFWLSIVSMAEPFVFAFSHQADALASIQFIAKWFPPLRDAQFLGFVAMMIFGVSLVKLHSCFGVKEADERLGRTGFVLWTFGLILRTVGWVYAFDRQFSGESRAMYFAGAIAIAIAAAMLVRASGIFGPLSQPMRSHKFVRGAFGWLLLSGAMLVLEPLHLRETGALFSHAYSGAVRHALTVGFISQMILGFGAHVVSRMNDWDESRLAPLWIVFALLNLGNLSRVALEVATDYTPLAYRPMGFTGFIELVALVIWAAHVAGPMLVRWRIQTAYAK